MFRLSGMRVVMGLCAATITISSGYADTVIKNSPANTGSYVLKDSGSILVDADITQTRPDGSGGLIDMRAGTVLTINRGRTLDVSATAAGKAGGSIYLEAPALIINGTLRANGKGSGSGGVIHLMGLGAGIGQKGIRIGEAAVLEAKGGEQGGMGGLIHIEGTGGTPISIASQARLETSGNSGSDANAIYITGDGAAQLNGYNVGLDISGQYIANNPSGTGGVIRFTSRDGDVWVKPDAHIQANGGTVEVTAQVADGSSGVLHQGVIDVSGQGQTPQGGTIRIHGDKIMQDGTLLSQGADGGTGGYIEAVSTQLTVLTENSLTSARGAGDHSDAGEIFIWSDDETYFNDGGVIDVRGGYNSGDGGFVEVSGANEVVFNGQALGGANNGEGGTILIDPTDINITDVGPFTNPLKDEWFSADVAANDYPGQVVTFDPRANGTFDGFRNIWLQATNNINIQSDFDTSVATGRNSVSLRLEARNNININADITTNNNTIILSADTNNNNSGDINMAAGTSIRSRGGDITLSGANLNLTTVDSSRNGADGTITLTARGNVSANSLNSDADNISITATGYITTTGGITGDAATLQANGYIDTPVNTAGQLLAYANGQNASGESIILSGTVGGQLIARNRSGGNTVGDILLGDETTNSPLNVSGTTTFLSNADVLGYGTFNGTVTGTGSRVHFWQIGSTNFTAGSITATGSSEFWAGYGNTLNIYAPDASILENGDGAVDLTTTNGGVTLWAGIDATKINSYIQTGISSAGDVYLWAAGDSNGASNGGTSIYVQTGNISGSIVAVDETWDKTTGNISINLNNGNLTTRDIGTGGNLTLVAGNGSILQDNAYGFDRNITIYATGDATLQAGNTAGDTTSAIGSFNNPVGIYVQGNTTLIAAGKNTDNDSVVVVGHVDGNTSVRDEANLAVSGDVYLGTSIGIPGLLDDTDGVMDTYGNVTVNALGDVYLNGAVALNGSVTLTGNRVIIRQDIGDTVINSITANAASGTAVDILNFTSSGIFGFGGAPHISTLLGGNVVLQAGDSYPADNTAYISGLDVNIGGDLSVIVAGDSNGTSPGGVSVNILGTVVGNSTATNELGGAPRGTIQNLP